MGKIGRPKKYYMTPKLGNKPVKMVKIQPVVGSMTTYADWLKMHLEEMQVTHGWLAWRIDSSESAVQQWACGKTVPTIRYFLRICRLITLATHRPFTDILIEAADCVEIQTCK